MGTQELRELSFKTLQEVKHLSLLLNSLDRSPHITILKLALARMKDLMIKTLKILKVANEKYQKAHETFDNIMDSVDLQYEIVGQALIKVEENYLRKKADTENKTFYCAVTAFL